MTETIDALEFKMPYGQHRGLTLRAIAMDRYGRQYLRQLLERLNSRSGVGDTLLMHSCVTSVVAGFGGGQ